VNDGGSMDYYDGERVMAIVMYVCVCMSRNEPKQAVGRTAFVFG